jgi:hypothetical protein
VTEKIDDLRGAFAELRRTLTSISARILTTNTAHDGTLRQLKVEVEGSTGSGRARPIAPRAPGNNALT